MAVNHKANTKRREGKQAGTPVLVSLHASLSTTN